MLCERTSKFVHRRFGECEDSQSKHQVVVMPRFALVVASAGLALAAASKCTTGDCTSGHGTWVTDDGEVYAGDWLNGKKHGHFRISFDGSEGEHIEGEWAEGNPVGLMAYTDASGAIFRGQFDGAALPEEERSDTGYPHSCGVKGHAVDMVLDEAEGVHYSGPWRNGIPHGRGKMVFVKDGSFYDGDFKHGIANGQGNRTMAGADTYAGGFLSGEAHGKGTTIYQNVHRSLSNKMCSFSNLSTKVYHFHGAAA